MKDQRVLILLVQAKSRSMDIFSVLTGLDLSKMTEDSEMLKCEMEIQHKNRKKKEEDDRIKA
jgi:hypothetical protein